MRAKERGIIKMAGNKKFIEDIAEEAVLRELPVESSTKQNMEVTRKANNT